MDETTVAGMPLDEDPYVSADDEDFDVDHATADQNVSDTSEEELVSGQGERRQGVGHSTRKNEDQLRMEVDDAEFENSGDEGIIKKAKKRKRKRRDSVPENDSGGEGGFVKTRSMKAVAEKDRAKQPLGAIDGNVTIDVDALWHSMKTASIVPQSTHLKPVHVSGTENAHQAPEAPDPEDAEMITVTETYTFAGKTQTRTATVPKNSARAKLFLSQNRSSITTTVSPVQRKGPEGQLLYRPLRRVSPWDPNPDGTISGLPTRRDGSNPVDAAGKPKKGLRVVDKSKLGWHSGSATLSAPAALVAAAKAVTKAPPKLNVVDKSKMDWAEHVDQAGDRDELERAAKSKGDYLERQRFLDRVEGKQDEDFARTRRKQ